MPKKRKSENRGLPKRWAHKHGAYYYIPHPDLRSEWEGKSWYLLGRTLPEAFKRYAEKITIRKDGRTIGDLLDRYALEEIPTKAKKTQNGYRKYVVILRRAFGEMLLDDIEPQHIYQYIDKRSAKVSARREIEVLSAAYTKAVQWGYIKAHPFKGQVRLEGEKPRTRYIEDWELLEALSLQPKTRASAIPVVQSYLRMKMLTGLRQRDLLLLEEADMQEDGLYVMPSKTRNSTGQSLIYEWTAELRAELENAIALRPVTSRFIFCTRTGECYVNAKTGEARSWSSVWQNFMARLLKDTKVEERFTEHDLRAKVGSDAESLERAQQLLSHCDIKLTKRVYRRKPERIKPTGGVGQPGSSS